MAARGFFSRHRILAGAVAPAALGVAALVAVAVAVDSPQSRNIDTELTASVTECYKMVSIGVAGRGDTPVAGTVDHPGTAMLLDKYGKPLPAALSGDYDSKWVGPVINAPNDKVDPKSYAAVYIAYPANMDSYDDAVATGVENTQAVMKAISASCPETQFSIVGYSEGADVVRRVATGIGNQKTNELGIDPDKVVGVVILADAGRTAGDGTFPGATNPFSNPNNFNTQYQTGGAAVPGQGIVGDSAGPFGKLGGKVASFCSDGDFTCSAPSNISLLVLAANVGRKLNVDRLEAEQLTPTTGQDVATVMGRVVFDAFNEISATPNWMQGDQTFLQVLLKVSDPSYVPGSAVTPVAGDSVTTDQVSPLAYLPQKLFKEIVGLIATNENTIPVVLSDPYNTTFGPDGVGHHFDYWRDANAAAGKSMTSAEYAAAWLTYLAQQAQDGKPVDTTAKPTTEQLAAAMDLYMENGGGAGGATDGKGTTTDATSQSGQAPSGTTGSTESSGAAATPSQAPAAGSASATSSAVASPTGSVAPTSSAAVTSAPTSQAASSDAAVTSTTGATTTTTTKVQAPAN